VKFGSFEIEENVLIIFGTLLLSGFCAYWFPGSTANYLCVSVVSGIAGYLSKKTPPTSGQGA
jgi:uncharacterized ion transporter superfamily protein YfcC